MSAADDMRNTLARAHGEWRATRFEVLVIRPDRSFEFYERVGGHAIDHSIEASELGGIGARVSVKPVEKVSVQ